MAIFSKEIALVLGTGTAAALIAATTWYQYNKRKNTVPEKWVEVGAVGNLWIYPLKSGQAMEVEEAECTETGLAYRQDNKLQLKDRGLLVYKEKDGEYRNAKNYPQMVLITVAAVSEHEIKLEAPDMNPLIIKIQVDNPKFTPCTLWSGEVSQCIDCGDEAAEWISQYCAKSDSGLRLGLCADWKRTINQAPWNSYAAVYKNLTSEDIGCFSDLASYLIFNQASLEDLNKKLPNDVSALNFRPNITVKGPAAFAEDDWDWIKIGEDIIFRNVKPCTRCVMVNINPETGIPEQAVLRTLREYRQVTDQKTRQLEGNSPVMGIYAGIRNPGHIKLGDKVYIGI